MFRLKASENGNEIDDFNTLRSSLSPYPFINIPVHLQTWYQMEVALFRQNTIILCGGILALSPTTNCLQHDVGSTSWTSFNMLVSRTSFALIFVNDQLWSLGGQSASLSTEGRFQLIRLTISDDLF